MMAIHLDQWNRNNAPTRKFIRLYLPGFTRGERNGTAGNDLGFNNEDGVGNDALVWPSDT